MGIYNFFEVEFLDGWNNPSLPVGESSLAYLNQSVKLFISIMKSIMLRNDCTNLHDWAFQYGEFATPTLLLLPKRGLKTLY